MSSLAVLRWNGLPGTVAVGAVEGPALAPAQKIPWARERTTVVAAAVPAAQGTGTILFVQLAPQNHVNAAEPRYDPVAEVLCNILGG